MKIAAFGLSVGLVAGIPATGLANDDIIAGRQVAGTKFAFLLKDTYSNVTVTVSGPGDFFAQASAKSGAIALDLREFGALDDGIFNYQITAASSEKIKVNSTLDNGRDRQPTEVLRSASTSGTFRVVRGTIVMPTDAKPQRKDQ
jgi:hypothetical protein